MSISIQYAICNTNGNIDLVNSDIAVKKQSCTNMAKKSDFNNFCVVKLIPLVSDSLGEDGKYLGMCKTDEYYYAFFGKNSNKSNASSIIIPRNCSTYTPDLSVNGMKGRIIIMIFSNNFYPVPISNPENISKLFIKKTPDCDESINSNNKKKIDKKEVKEVKKEKPKKEKPKKKKPKNEKPKNEKPKKEKPKKTEVDDDIEIIDSDLDELAIDIDVDLIDDPEEEELPKTKPKNDKRFALKDDDYEDY